MHKHTILPIACVVLIAAVLPFTATAAPAWLAPQADQPERHPEAALDNRTGEEPQQEAPAVETRLYALSHISLESAYTLALSACRENDRRAGAACSVEVLENEGTLVVTSVETIHDRVAALLREVDKPPYTQTFHIIVLAATNTSAMPTDLPPGAQRAVEDIKSFLPYEGFRVLDTGWLKTVRSGQTMLTGPAGFEVGLEFRGDPRSDEPLLVQTFRMTVMEPPVVLPEGVQGETRGARQRMILETSFTMDVGETVVVGTSKLNGGDEPTALVILLTALDPEGDQ